MNSDKLEKANKLKEEISQLDRFLSAAEKVWAGKLTIKEKIMRIKSSAYGGISSKELDLDTELKNKVLDLLREYKKELENEFNEI